MIRILVLVLAAANLLYFGWAQWVRQEQPRLVAPSLESTSDAATPAAATSATQTSCTTLGPVNDEARVLEISQALDEMQIMTAQRTVTEDARDGWWVYVSNRDAASQARSLRAIQAAGIRDAFAMPDDPQFRVSVGLFTEEAGARTRAEAVRALKLDAVVSERTQQRTVTWFDMAGATGAAVDLARLAAEGIEVRDLRLAPCPDEEIPVESILPQSAAAPMAGPGAAPKV